MHRKKVCAARYAGGHIRTDIDQAEAVLRDGMKHHGYSFKTNYLLGAVLVNEGNWTGEAKTKLEYAQVKYPEAKALLAKWPAN